MDTHKLKPALHPLYSLDIITYNFFPFNHVTMVLQGSVFKSVEEFLEDVMSILIVIQLEILLPTFHEWMDRFQTCIDEGAEYIEWTFLWLTKFLLIWTGNRDAKKELQHHVIAQQKEKNRYYQQQ
jgi:hypothetical protein